MRVGLLDYGGGNLRSVANALHALEVVPVVVNRPEQFADLTHLILPGQGEFGDVMSRLVRADLVDSLKTWLHADKPYFGICVGYQILFERSVEAPGVDGLGLIRGSCVRFRDEAGKKIPQMGWNMAKPQQPVSRFWQGLGSEPYFYFVHSYFPVPEDDTWIVSVTDYAGEKFAASVEKGNILACQFHPEKSQDAGLRLIRNFLRG